MKNTFFELLVELRNYHRTFSAILAGIEPPNAYTMPDDLQVKINICKKHESVLLLNIKTFVMQARHRMQGA